MLRTRGLRWAGSQVGFFVFQYGLSYAERLFAHCHLVRMDGFLGRGDGLLDLAGIEGAPERKPARDGGCEAGEHEAWRQSARRGYLN